MGHMLVNEFCWIEFGEVERENLTEKEKYQQLVSWAGKARGTNPNAFDAVTKWLLDDAQWQGSLSENECILMKDIIGRFKEQTERLRACLLELKTSGMVNEAVFDALDRFEDELSGRTHAEYLKDSVEQMFRDFSSMKDRNVREQIAGGKTGPTGTDTVEIFGYINFLKDCDAAVQWTLFMPDVVEKQQDGFKLESFVYRKMPAVRFIGKDERDVPDMEARSEIFRILDSMNSYRSGFDYDLLFMHHYGKGVDVSPWHGFWGRFMKADAPVPQGFVSFDLVPENNGKPGAPFISQFAYAIFSGDPVAMHMREKYDSDGMYDMTRNCMLAQGVNIPYPDKYWTAEVFLKGYSAASTAYLFSAEL